MRKDGGARNGTRLGSGAAVLSAPRAGWTSHRRAADRRALPPMAVRPLPHPWFTAPGLELCVFPISAVFCVATAVGKRPAGMEAKQNTAEIGRAQRGDGEDWSGSVSSHPSPSFPLPVAGRERSGAGALVGMGGRRMDFVVWFRHPRDPPRRFGSQLDRGARSALAYRADRNHMQRIQNVENSLFILNHYVVAGETDKLTVRCGVFLPVGGANDEGTWPRYLFLDGVRVHAVFVAPMGAPVKQQADH